MDLTGQIIDAITGRLQTLAAALIAPTLEAATQMLFSTPAFDQIPEVARLWSVLRVIADSLFVLATLAAGVLVMSSGSSQSRYSAKVLVPLLVLAAIAANASLAFAGALISLDNALVTSVVGADPAGQIGHEFAAALQGAHPVNQYVTILIALWAAILALLLVAMYLGRNLVLLLGTVLAPIALGLYALPQTEEIAHLWLRAYTALLFVQVVQAALVVIGLQVIRRSDWFGGAATDLTSGLMLVALLYLLFKLPLAAYQWAFRQRISQSAVAQPILIAARAARALV